MKRLHRPPHSGYSLLEVLLALALTVVVVGVVSMSVKLYLVVLTKQKVAIERKQIARAVLTMMTSDIRAAIQYKAADYSGLENLVQTQQMMLGAGLPSESGIELDAESLAGMEAGSEDIAASSASTATAPGTDAEAESSIVDEENVSYRPALLGSSSALMLDISRLPRIDQYNPLVALQDSANQTTSDVKSIAWFVSTTANESNETLEFDSGAPGGLYRRAIDRAVAAYQGELSLVDTPDESTDLLASEVAQIEFRYFDGSDWQVEWNSAEVEGFPLAIEISIVIDPARTSENNTTYAYPGFDAQTMELYRQVVHLPVAERATSE